MRFFDDVLAALEAGRCSLVLTERRDHLEMLRARFEKFAKNVVALRGGMGSHECSGACTYGGKEAGWLQGARIHYRIEARRDGWSFQSTRMLEASETLGRDRTFLTAFNSRSSRSLGRSRSASSSK